MAEQRKKRRGSQREEPGEDSDEPAAPLLEDLVLVPRIEVGRCNPDPRIEGSLLCEGERLEVLRALISRKKSIGWRDDLERSQEDDDGGD